MTNVLHVLTYGYTDNPKQLPAEWPAITQDVSADTPLQPNWLLFATNVDYTGLVGYAMKDRDFQEPDAWFCSEIGETSFIHGDTPHFTDQRSSVSPKELWQCKRNVLLTSYA